MALFKGNKSKNAEQAQPVAAAVAPRGKLHDAADAVALAERAFMDANADAGRLHSLVVETEGRIDILTMTATAENAGELANARALLDAYRRQHAVAAANAESNGSQLRRLRDAHGVLEVETRRAQQSLTAALARYPLEMSEAADYRGRAAAIEGAAQNAVDTARAALVALTGASE